MSGYKFIEFCDKVVIYVRLSKLLFKIENFFYNDRYKIRALLFLDVILYIIYEIYYLYNIIFKSCVYNLCLVVKNNG